MEGERGAGRATGWAWRPVVRLRHRCHRWRAAATTKRRDVVAGFLGADDADATITDIRETIAAETGAGWRELLTPALRPARYVGVGLALVQQLTGINTVIYYAPQIFRDAGLTSSSAAIAASVSVSAVNILSTFIAIRYVDRLGRQPLLTVGIAGMTVSLAVLAIAFDTFTGTLLSIAAIGSLMIYVCLFAFSLLFVRARVPETRGRTLEEIEADLDPHGTAGATPEIATA